MNQEPFKKIMNQEFVCFSLFLLSYYIDFELKFVLIIDGFLVGPPVFRLTGRLSSKRFIPPNRTDSIPGSWFN